VDGTATGLDIDCISETIQIGGPPGQILPENARRLAMTGRFDGDPATDWLLGSWTANSLTQAATGIVVSVECMDNPIGTVTFGGFYEGDTMIPSIVLEAEVPFHFSLAQMFQIGPDITFTITHKMAHFGT
jgi:hypothetical protein